MSDSTPAQQNFCPSCGQPRDADAVFCEECGVGFDSGTLLSSPVPRKSHVLRWVLISVLAIFVLLGALIVMAAIGNQRSAVTASQTTKDTLPEATMQPKEQPTPDAAVDQRQSVVPSKGAVWAPMSHTAMAITGNVQLAEDKVVIDGADFPLTLVRSIEATMLGDAGKIVGVTQPSSATLYKTNILSSSKFENGSTLCGDDAVTWILTVYEGESQLSMALFSSVEEPSLKYDVVSTGHDLCGTYSYSR